MEIDPYATYGLRNLSKKTTNIKLVQLIAGAATVLLTNFLKRAIFFVIKKCGLNLNRS